jgi:hypothetical protein
MELLFIAAATRRTSCNCEARVACTIQAVPRAAPGLSEAFLAAVQLSELSQVRQGKRLGSASIFVTRCEIGVRAECTDPGVNLHVPNIKAMLREKPEHNGLW